MTKFFSLTILLAALLQSACTPTGYVEAPAMSSYYQQIKPKERDNEIKTIAICSGHNNWYTSIYFRDKNLYHYELNPGSNDSATARLVSMSTYKQRDDSNLLCVGSSQYLTGLKEYGEFRFELSGGDIYAYVKSSYAADHTFNEKTKEILNSAAVAVNKAITAQAEFDPFESSWGIDIKK